MCVNQREIKNKYTGQHLYVKCGHCPACLQEKAAYRVSRINAQNDKGLTCVMVALTYRRNDAPYVLRDEAFKFSRGEIKSLNVYRDNYYRKVRQNAAYDIDYKKINGTHVLTTVDFVNSSDFHGLKDLAHCHGRIGVTYYPDIQEFIARLRINLKRNFNFTHEIKSYCCSEYGTKTHRPHSHILFWIPKGTYEVFRIAVLASWPYGDISRFKRSVEEAYQAASYCASYVNCTSDFPTFLRDYFRPKHSYSKGFGCNHDLFKLPKILDKFKRGSLSCVYQKLQGQQLRIIDVPYPKYVIHRYFPKFKGYNRVAPASLVNLMERFAGLYERKTDSTLERLFLARSLGLNRIAFPVYYSDLDAYQISVRLRNAYKRFLDCSGLDYSFQQYAELHTRIWSCYQSTLLRLHMENPEIPLNEKYDNLENVRCKIEAGISQIPVGFTHNMFAVTDPNKFMSVRYTTGLYTKSYHEHIKHRCVNNVILSSINEEF